MTRDHGRDDDAADGAGDEGGLASVVLVDRREDIAAICGRVDASPTYAVVIHAPDGNRQLATELGMRRLRRHAEESGKLIAIATTAVALAARARQVGIPVARRPQYIRWDAPGRRVVRLFGRSFALPALGRYIQALALLVVVATVAGLGLTVAPAATIIVSPPVETRSRTITVTAIPGRDGIDFARMLLPASRVSASQVVTLAVKTTGKAAVGTKAAKVIVAITNPTSATIRLPKGAVLQAGPDRFPFVLDQETAVPGGQAVTQQASASRLGAGGNVAAGTLNAWLDPKYRVLALTNPAAATGGVSEERAGVAPADLVAITALAKELEKSETLRHSIVAARPHDAVFLRTAESTAKPGEPSAAAGTPADVLLLEVKVTVSALAIVTSTLEDVARRLLRPTDGQAEFIAGSVTAAETGNAQSSEANSFSTELSIAGDFARNVAPGDIREVVKGKSRDSAKSTLMERYGIQDITVDLTPGWAPWLPRFDFRIDVKLQARPTGEPTKGPTTDAATPTPIPRVTPAPGP